MTFVSRVLLSLTGLAGASSAIGVPVALSAQSGQRRSAESILGGGGNLQISLNRCDESDVRNSQDISFGSQQDREVCWSTDSNSLKPENSNKYTELFKEQGMDKNRNGNGNNNTDFWTQQCLDRSSPGALLTSNTGLHYLGMCSDTNLENTIFAKKGKGLTTTGNLEEWTLSVCDSDCGEVEQGTMGGSPEALTREKSQNGKIIKFYSRNQKNIS